MREKKVSRQEQLNIDLFRFLNNQDLEAVKVALDAGADVNAVKEGGMKALHVAVRKKDANAVRMLLERGADVHAVDSQRWAAVHQAVSSAGDAILEILRDYGADLNAKNDSGRTPLHIASSLNHSHICQFLLAEGADVLAVDLGGRSALEQACQWNSLYCALMLIAYGAKKEGLTSSSEDVAGALHLNELQAAVCANLAVKVVELLDAGMDPTDCGKSVEKKNAMELAQQLGLVDIFDVIKAHQSRRLAMDVIDSLWKDVSDGRLERGL